MKKLSTSPIKFTHHQDRYVLRCEKNNDPVRDDILEMYLNMSKETAQLEANPDWAKNNLEYDLRTTDWILQKVRNSKVYAQNLYAALCNNSFQRNAVWPILKDEQWSCSWRYAGGIIADMREEGDYMDWYCSGIRDTLSDPTENELNSWTKEQLEAHTTIYKYYVGESFVTDTIRNDLVELGWNVVTDQEDII
jgi:hypothetical protein